MDHYKVKGHPNLIRDNSTKAILNTNNTEYQNYLSIKKSKEFETKRIENIEYNINNLKNDLNEMKILLKKLTER